MTRDPVSIALCNIEYG